MTKDIPKVEYKWDEKTKKLTRDIRVTRDDMEEHAVQTYTKDGAKKLLDNIKTQVDNVGKFIAEAEECKTLNEKKTELPMYKEFEQLQKAFRWDTDRQIKAQYDQAVKNFDVMKGDLEALEKELPKFKN